MHRLLVHLTLALEADPLEVRVLPRNLKAFCLGALGDRRNEVKVARHALKHVARQRLQRGRLEPFERRQRSE